VLSDVNFQNNYTLNNFLLITKTTEHEDVEENQHDVISSFFESEKLTQTVNVFAKQLKVCAKAWGDIMNIHGKCRMHW